MLYSNRSFRAYHLLTVNCPTVVMRTRRSRIYHEYVGPNLGYDMYVRCVGQHHPGRSSTSFVYTGFPWKLPSTPMKASTNFRGRKSALMEASTDLHGSRSIFVYFHPCISSICPHKRLQFLPLLLSPTPSFLGSV